MVLLPTPGSLHQNRIFATEPAQKLYETIQFLLAPNQRLSVVHQIADISTEFIAHGRSFLPLRRFVRLPDEFLTDLAQSDTSFRQDLRGKAFFLA